MIAYEEDRTRSPAPARGEELPLACATAVVAGIAAGLLGPSLVAALWETPRISIPAEVVFGAGNLFCLTAIALWAVAVRRRHARRERQIAEELRAQEEARAREEGELARLERAAASERLSRLTAENALREKDDLLRQAQKLEAIGSLAGGVAHDFNNLLTVVLSYADILAVGLTPANPMWEGLDEIRQAGERAADLTKQLLAFSRKQVLSPTVLDLDQVIEGMLKMLQRLIGTGIELTHMSSHDLGKVHLDRGQTEQVLLNLVVNARDALPHGGKIQIETSNTEVDPDLAEQIGVAPGPHVLLTVRDTGTGIDAATAEHIFEPFFTTKEKGKGTGLGLSVVFGIVRQSGGHIAVASEPGKGTTFTLRFPRTTAASKARAAAEPARQAHRGTETVLLVEDEEQVRHVASAILRRSGYHVLDAATGGDALLLSEQHEGPIDLLLADVVMPRLRGDRLNDRLAAMRSEMKVLYMSGCAEETILKVAVGATPPAFLPKPLTPDTLLRKVREVLDGAEKPPDQVEIQRRRESAEWRERRRSKTHTPRTSAAATPQAPHEA